MNVWFESLSEWVWRTSLQASVLIVLVMAAQALFRQWLKPKWQYALGVLVLIRLLLPATPESRLSIFHWGSGLVTASQESRHLVSPHPSPLPWGEGESSATLRQAELSGLAEATGTAFPLPEGEGQGEGEQDARWTSSAVSLTEHAAKENTLVAPVQPQEATIAWRSMPALKWGWALGFCLIALSAFWRHRRFTQWVKTQTPIADTRIIALLDDAKEVMGITTSVEVRRVERLSTPALFGFRRPCLLVPAGVLDRLIDSELRMVMLHELAHLKRRDVLLNWIIILVRAMHWFNPLVWLAMRRLRADRELVCDEMVLAYLNADERRLYGHTLLKLLEHFSMIRLSPGLVPVINRKNEIKRRVIMIAQFKTTNRLSIGLSAVLIVSLCLLTFTEASEDKNAGSAARASDERQQNRAQDKSQFFKNPWKQGLEGSAPTPATANADPRRGAVNILEDQLKTQEAQLEQAQQRVDQLRRDLHVSDSYLADNSVRTVEAETVRMIERDRVVAKSLQAQYMTLHSNLVGLPKDVLRKALPTASPDTMLTELMSRLAQTETEIAAYRNEFSNQNPKFIQLTSIVKALDSQIDDRVEGILKGLETQAKAQEARAAVLEEEERKARQRDAELTAKYRPYFQAKRDLETQQRIYETIKLRLFHETVDSALLRANEEAGRAPLRDSTGIMPIKKPDVTSSQRSEPEAPSATQLERARRINEDLLKTFIQNKEYREHRSLLIEMTPEGLLINLLDNAAQPIFDIETNSVRFTKYGGWIFDTVSWEIARYPSTAIELEGHTEKGFKPVASDYTDWEVSLDEASAARQRLLKNGVSEAQIDKVSGLAGTKPLRERNAVDRSNRRVSILIRAGR